MIKTKLRTKFAVGSTYDKESKLYDFKRFQNPGGRYIDQVEKQLLRKYLKRGSILEIGTATGRFVGFVLETGSNYTGLDLSRVMLKHVSESESRLIQADGERLPFAAESFDAIICLHTFHFLPEPLTALREMYRALKPGGSLVLIFELDNWLRRIVLSTGLFVSQQYYYTVPEVSSMMKSTGFSVDASGSVLKFPMAAYRRLPFTPLLRVLDLSDGLPAIFETLGFTAGQKPAA